MCKNKFKINDNCGTTALLRHLKTTSAMSMNKQKEIINAVNNEGNYLVPLSHALLLLDVEWKRKKQRKL